MKFSVDSNTIKKLILMSGGVSKNKESILSNYLVIVKDKKISIISSNETTQMHISMPIDSETECEFLAKPDLFDRLKLLNGNIDFKLEKNLLTVKNGFYETTAKVFDKQDYPLEIIDNYQSVYSLEANDVSELIKAHIASIEREDISREFTGVLIDINQKKANFVGTNRTRLLWISKPIDDDVNFYCIVEKDSILQLKHILKADDKVNLLYKSDGENITNVAFKSSDWMIISRAISGKFPQYQSITIEELQEVKCVSFDKELLKSALQKVLTLSDNELTATKFDIKENNMSISTTNKEGETANDIVDFTSCNHKPINLTVNGDYAIDFVNNIQSDTVKFYYKEMTKPVEIKAINENNISYVYIMTLIS